MERQGKTSRPALKICGVRDADATAQCARLGVELVGYNLCRASKRWIEAAAAAAAWRQGVAAAGGAGGTRPALVFVDASDEEIRAALAAFPEAAVLQLHGRETPDDLRRLRALAGPRALWKAVPVRAEADVAAASVYAAACDLLLFDTAAAAPGAAVLGGSGLSFDWRWLASRPRGVALGVAGGIKPGTERGLAELAAHRPDVIDVCSGVEAAPGVKDQAKVAAMWREVQALAFAALVAVMAWGGASERAEAQDEVFQRAAQTIIGGEELHRWDRYVRGFRREHNFALTSGVSSGTWLVKRFGTIDDRRYTNSGVYTRFQYSFHLPLYEGFGFLLGSSVGYHYESADRREPFRPVAAYQFPGVLAGLVLNVNPVLRLGLGFDAYLERHNGLQERDGQGIDPEIHVTMQAFDFSAFLDIFYDLSWALRLEAHQRHVEYLRPKPPQSGESFPVDANIKKDDQWLGLGLVYHLL